MSRNYTLQRKILRPAAEVFEAVISSDKLKSYFVDSTTSNLVEGERVVWQWTLYGAHPLVVRKIIKNQLIELVLDSKEWKKTQNESYEVLVIFEFEEQRGITNLSISEQGWKNDPEGLKGSHDNCEGWTHMKMCLKAYIEHGIDMR